jgi:flagellar biosynthesis protein FlhB
MAGDDRTEKPTAKRLREARKKGQVAKSTDLSGAGVLIAGLIAVSLMAPAVVNNTGNVMTSIFGLISTPHAVSSAAGLNGIFHLVLSTVLKTMLPIAAICVAAAVLVNVAMIGGLRPNMGAVTPDFKKINPAAGFKNVFGPRIAFEAGKALLKVGVVGAIVALALLPDLTHLGASVGTSPYALGRLMSAGVTGIAERAAAAYLLIGVIDYVYQRRKHNKSLKMTKQEVKDETKQQNLPPEVRAALRRRQIQQARARMMAAVPKADVVVTNPTHYAVALMYNGDHPAPIVVAKGQDHVAFQIRKIAEEHDIPIVPDPPLARELHRVVELGQMIPAELYAAVAQVLAFVYRLAARKKVGV